MSKSLRVLSGFVAGVFGLTHAYAAEMSAVTQKQGESNPVSAASAVDQKNAVLSMSAPPVQASSTTPIPDEKAGTTGTNPKRTVWYLNDVKQVSIVSSSVVGTLTGPQGRTTTGRTVSEEYKWNAASGKWALFSKAGNETVSNEWNLPGLGGGGRNQGQHITNHSLKWAIAGGEPGALEKKRIGEFHKDFETDAKGRTIRDAQWSWDELNIHKKGHEREWTYAPDPSTQTPHHIPLRRHVSRELLANGDVQETVDEVVENTAAKDVLKRTETKKTVLGSVLSESVVERILKYKVANKLRVAAAAEIRKHTIKILAGTAVNQHYAVSTDHSGYGVDGDVRTEWRTVKLSNGDTSYVSVKSNRWTGALQSVTGHRVVSGVRISKSWTVAKPMGQAIPGLVAWARFTSTGTGQLLLW